MKCAALALALAPCLGACGDDVHPIDPRLTGECIATFTGNFDEQSIAAANCPTITGTGAVPVTLGFSIRSETLGSIVGISIRLGIAPPPGRYTSTNALGWSALGQRDGCVYLAGDTAVPPGNYVLDLHGTHGRLELVQHVLAIEAAACPPGDKETIAIDF